MTHSLDKTWTRIYNPEQSAVDRCDPEGVFIQRWLPELAHLSPEQLGSPPPVKGYPAPILNYKQARRQRVQQLERQRRAFVGTQNVVPHLAPLPASLMPFGSDRVASDTAWARQLDRELFPAALDVGVLDLAQAEVLRSWFVATVEHRSRTTARSSQPKLEANEVQLSLL